jgi:glycyl-tRNA synthetase beta chain
MSELLFEIFCEEIPAGMQAKAASELETALVKALGAAGLKAEQTRSLVGARRMTLVMTGLPAKADDVSEERKGPRVGAPEKALEGFLRGAGLDSLDACEQREDKKGTFWVARIEKPGRQTTEVLAEAIPAIISGFHWPKSMKIGEGDKAQRWVRPIQRLVCVFDGAPVKFSVFGLEAGCVTEGHRVLGRGPFTVSDFESYQSQLEGEGHVILDAEQRKAMILDGARKVCSDAGLELVEDQGLLNEVCGLVEWPVPVLGEMDPDFLDLPPEVITLTMKTHQKYFAVRDPKTSQLSAHFVTVANQDAPDGGKAIAAGNARVLSARLSDARHFWDNDRKTKLADMASQLSKITFHEKLGTVADKVSRVAQLAREIAPIVGADEGFAETAARLSKADLVSEMVYEFPELQGAMGRYYAMEQGEPTAVADAIRDHYRPQGPGDQVPALPVSAAVALADKLDTLVGFWAIDEKPTGSKDPFALRRAALGVIRILLEGEFRFSLVQAIAHEYQRVDKSLSRAEYAAKREAVIEAQAALGQPLVALRQKDGKNPLAEFKERIQTGTLSLFEFFGDRLKVHLRDEGIRHDVIDAVFALGDPDIVRVTARSRALQAFLDTEDGAALLAGFNRAANILKAEEKKAGERYVGAPEDSYLAAPPDPAEKALIAAIAGARVSAGAALRNEDFTAAMAALATLRAPIDAFFETVTVNADDAGLRRNRLLLLSDIRAAIFAVADFGRIEG